MWGLCDYRAYLSWGWTKIAGEAPAPYERIFSWREGRNVSAHGGREAPHDTTSCESNDVLTRWQICNYHLWLSLPVEWVPNYQGLLWYSAGIFLFLYGLVKAVLQLLLHWTGWPVAFYYYTFSVWFLLRLKKGWMQFWYRMQQIEFCSYEHLKGIPTHHNPKTYSKRFCE